MPRGAKPKVYPAALVEQVRQLYAQELTQVEVAREVGLSQKVVFNVMRRHGLPARPAAKRNQRGSCNASWKGNAATYAAFHKRVEALRGRPMCCDRCGTTDPEKAYDWANLTGDYADVNDYERMCRSCHRRFDNGRRAGGDANA